MKYLAALSFFLLLNSPPPLVAQNLSETALKSIESQVILWRRHLHQHPELSNREFKTGKYIDQELKKMGIETETGVAHTGVVGFIKGGQPGPTVALRADIDALPVTERVDLPFASKVKTTYLGEEVGVMHACGHDTHVAMLLGAAQLLKAQQSQLRGNILLIFQPAEEGAPPGEQGGAELIVKEGILEKYNVAVIFGQHISSGTPVGKINYRVGGMMAASDRFTIKVKGKQAHGSRPWGGVDPITVSAQIIMGLQTIISRQTNLTREAAVISIGKIQGGVRNNIIPEEVEMIGTIRTLDTEMQKTIHQKIRQTATLIAESAGATAEVDIQVGYPVTYNNPTLTRKMINTLYDCAGEQNVRVVPAITGAEDFSFYAQQVPGLFYFLGGRSPSVAAEDAPGHHTPDFYIDESGMLLGVKTMVRLALDYMVME
ncbi:MAG: amidohydrolase [Bacteroidota bacterium]